MSSQVPILLLKEGSTETKDKDAQRNNITAAKLVTEMVKSSLGPRGMDKMLVDTLGDVTITNDGATILKEIDVQHPAAKMMVEMTKKIKIIKNENDNTLEKSEINQDKNTFENLLDKYNSSQSTNKYIFDLQTLYLLRQNRILDILNKRYQYDTSLKHGQEFLLNHVNSKMSLVVMYIDLVDSTVMSRDLQIDKLVTIIRAFTHELSSVIENHNGLILKYVGDGIISFFPSGFNKYLACDKAVQCAKSIIDTIKNGINPILHKCDYPTLSIKIGIDEGENAIVQYGYDKSSLIDIVGYSMNIAAKITALTNKNKISIGEDIYKLLHPTIQSEFRELILHTSKWKYTNRTTNKKYKVYTIH